jgi:peptidoglycan/LPS O-acetylase OafA/YrhL
VFLSNALASHTRPDFLVGQSVRNIGIAVCIDWCLRNSDSLVGKFLNVPALVWLGTLSYSLYLWQQPFLNRNSAAVFCAYPLNVLLALVFAAISYYAIERPCLKLRARMFARADVRERSVSQLAASEELSESSPNIRA